MIEISLSQGNKSKVLEESINLFRIKTNAVGEAGLIDLNAIIKKMCSFPAIFILICISKLLKP